VIDLVALQNSIHQQNREMGWWDKPRSFATMVCLFHSELSEAMEGDRKNLMDDHLPQYPMFQVEIADFVIRCLDYLGSVGFDEYDSEMWSNAEVTGKDDIGLIALLHALVSSAYIQVQEREDENDNSYTFELSDAVSAAFRYCDLFSIPLETIINEKVAYNKNRVDHQRAARAAENGKKY
jgi:hypothetical protein